MAIIIFQFNFWFLDWVTWQRKLDSVTWQKKVYPVTWQRKVNSVTWQRKVDSVTWQRKVDPVTWQRKVDPVTWQRKVDPVTWLTKVDPSSKNIFGNCLPFRSTWVRLVFYNCLSGICVIHVAKLTCLHVFSSVLWCSLRFLRKKICSIHLYSHFCYVWCSCFIYVFLYSFTYTGVHYDVHVRWCSCRVTVTWRVPLVEQGMLTLTEHQSSSRFLVRFVLLDL